jgi:protein-S-isoprenylcysteine O-methyltransferase Ste14
VVILRLMLFLGLVCHKLVWEVLKRGQPRRATQQSAPVKKSVWLVKSIKVAALLFIIVQTLFLNVLPISSNPAPLRVIGTAIYLLGLGTAILGRLHLGRNWANLEDFQVMSKQVLVTHGIYQYVRHPIYTGDILLILGLELALNSWLVLGVIALIAVIVRQVMAEEVLLARAFPDYDTYRKHTKMFIPGMV